MDKQDVITLLQSQNINPTKQRIEIAELLFERPQHLCAEQIIDSIRQSGNAKVSKATVYNTLKLFSQAGLLRELFLEAGKVFYDSNNSKHHHVYNIDTGEIWDLEDTSEEGGEISPGLLPSGLNCVAVDVIYRVSGKT